MPRALVALGAATLGLLGSLAATLFVFGGAEVALDRVLEERLRGAGESAALLLGGGAAGGSATLQALMTANALEGACLLDRSLVMLTDAGGRTGQRADLLRVDPDRVQRAFSGAASVGPGYAVGGSTLSTGYFPVRAKDGSVAAVLAFEAGRSFLEARRELGHARTAAVLLSVLSASALGVVAARWTRAERVRQQAAERAARGDSIAKMAAMVAHEIRNPLGIIRGTAELMRERAGAELPEWQRTSLDDLLAEVARMRRLTDDFLSLGTPERPLAVAQVDLAELLADAARGAEVAGREVRVRTAIGPLPAVVGDAGRLRQVFANLLSNAVQAQERGEIELSAQAVDGLARVRVRDGGPGLPQVVRERLFDPFLTTKPGGTGLGLAIARMLVERHGGTLTVVEEGRPGTTFEVCLPVAAREGAAA